MISMIFAILIFIAVLGLLVFVHELGHFGAAKFFKVGVEEFGFGYPPKIFGIKKGKTEYSLNWIPVGGFVKIKGVIGGEEGEGDKTYKEDEDSFSNKPIWQRFSILFAGVLMNFLLTIALFSVGYMIGLPMSLEGIPETAKVSQQQLVIVESLENTPAGDADVQTGDKIISLNGTEVHKQDEFKALMPDGEAEIKLYLEREGEIIEKNIKSAPILENDNKIGLGISYAETGVVKFSWFESIYRGAQYATKLAGMIIQALWNILASVFTSQKAGVDFSGPVGIAVMTNQFAKMGMIYLLQFTALLSINLAIFNLLPIPALDGGRLIFLIIEKIKGSPVNQKIEVIVHNAGFILLIGLLVLATFRDVFKYEVFDSIKNLFV